MKCVLQIVKKAVVVKNKTKSVIGQLNSKGIFILLGIGRDDSKMDAEVIAKKISLLRLFPDEFGRINKSILNEKSAGVLVVSQFTLYADLKKGNRPSFLQAADFNIARNLYEYFIDKLKSYGILVSTGAFGEEMEIKADLRGPITIILNSKEL